MMSAMDDAVGAVTAELARAGLDGNTLVFFLNDNGGPTNNASSNAPLRGGKATTWEGGTRVAFLLRWAGHLSAGRVYDQPVAQIDVLPTALAAAACGDGARAGVTAEPGWKLDGVNLLPFLRGEDPRPPHEALFWRFGDQMAVRMGDWKLVRGRAGHDAPIARAQLFDLAADAGEHHDLSARNPETVRRLQAAWERWNAELVPPRWGNGGGLSNSAAAHTGPPE